MASAGGKQAEANIIAALFDEGDEVIIPTPAWVSFVAMVNLAGAEAKLVECPEDHGFNLDPASAAQCDHAANSRHHSQFAVESDRRGVLAESARRAGENPARGRPVGASDDVYEHIVYDGAVPHIFQIEPRLKAKGFTLNSLSKAYAMTGWRIGFAAGPKK